MMNLRMKVLPPGGLEKYRGTLLRFAEKFGDGRITRTAMHWLHNVSPAQLEQPEDVIVVALEEGTIIGLGCAAGRGDHSSFIVVHPQYRGRQVGQKLLATIKEQTGKLTCTVAVDNIPSLTMCFRAGLHAVDLFEGPTGKPTLKFVSSIELNEADGANEANEANETNDLIEAKEDIKKVSIPCLNPL